MNRFLSSLRTVCRDQVLSEKWLIAPSLRVGHQWIDRVALSGQPVVNVRLKTLRTLAIELASETMSCAGVALASPLLASLAVGRTFSKMAEQGSGYFARPGYRPETAQSIVATLQDLRLGGITSEELRPDCFEVPEKSRELQNLLDEYEKDLHGRKLVDYAGVLQLAVKSVAQYPSSLADVLILIPGDLSFMGLEQDLVKSIPAASRVFLPIDEPGTNIDDGTPLTNALRLRWIRDVENAPPRMEDNTAVIFPAVGAVNEIREVLRLCKERHWPLDSVELLHTDYETYVPLVYEIIQLLQEEPADGLGDLPVTFAEGIPVRYARAGRALIAWTQWIREGFPQSVLVQMLQDELLSVPDSKGRSSAKAPRLASLLRSVAVRIGRERYPELLRAKMKELQYRIQHMEQSASEEDEVPEDGFVLLERALTDFQVLLETVEGLIAVTPRIDSPGLQVLQNATQFLDTCANSVTELDHLARQALCEHIADVLAVVGDDMGIVSSDNLEWLSRQANEMRVGGSGPRPGRLHVAHVLSGGHSGRPHTFIIGLDDARLPGTGKQDPFLLDSERMAISPDRLQTSGHNLKDKIAAFENLLARLRGTIALGFPCHDLQNDRELFPSPLLLDSYRVLSGDLQPELGAFTKAVGPSASFAPTTENKALNDNEWWLWRLLEGPSTSDAVESVRRSFLHLEQGAVAEASRRASAFTIYDGYVPALDEKLRPLSRYQPVFSASRLETLAACPLRYFFKHILHVEPPEELDPAEDVWLEPSDYGRLLHDVFRDFMRLLVGRGQLPDAARDERALLTILDKHVLKWRELTPPTSEALFQLQHKDLLKTVRTFLRGEESLCATSRPLYCEAAIGLPPDGDGTPIDTPEPIPITLPSGATIRVRGRIDRIDRVGAPAAQLFSLWDYKTGSSSGYDVSSPLKNGRKVQPTLYIEMAQGVLHARAATSRAQIKQFGYSFPGVKADGERLVWPPEKLRAGKNKIECLCHIMEAGTFIASNDKNDCKYCDYKAACVVDEVTLQSKAKLDDGNNIMLASFKELRSNEKE